MCNCFSSLNEWCAIECESIMVDKSLIYKIYIYIYIIYNIIILIWKKA